MTYELIIDADKEKELITFLKHLDFVTVRKIVKKTAIIKEMPVSETAPSRILMQM